MSVGERDASKREMKSGLKVKEEGLFSGVFYLFFSTGEW